MLLRICKYVGIPSLVLSAALAPLVASACITCSETISCNSHGCKETVTCTYSPGQCEGQD
jgi:hypothetical protein